MTDEGSLQTEVDAAIAAYESLDGHPATRTKQMLAAHGTVKALARLVSTGDLQQGFRTLVDRGRAALTFEAVIIRHAPMFRPEVVEAAKFRLREAGVDPGLIS